MDFSWAECQREYKKILKKMGIGGGKVGGRFHAIKKFNFPSESHPGKNYTTQINSDSSITCNCPGWIFKRAGKERVCKHTIQVASELCEKERHKR